MCQSLLLVQSLPLYVSLVPPSFLSPVSLAASRSFPKSSAWSRSMAASVAAASVGFSSLSTQNLTCSP